MYAEKGNKVLAGKRKTTLEIEVDLWKEVSKAGIDRGITTFTEILDQALRLWLHGNINGGKPKEELPPEIQHIVKLFATPEGELTELDRKFKLYAQAFFNLADELQRPKK